MLLCMINSRFLFAIIAINHILIWLNFSDILDPRKQNIAIRKHPDIVVFRSLLVEQVQITFPIFTLDTLLQFSPT